MARKIIDLSVVLDDTIPADPPNLEALPKELAIRQNRLKISDDVQELDPRQHRGANAAVLGKVDKQFLDDQLQAKIRLGYQEQKWSALGLYGAQFTGPFQDDDFFGDIYKHLS